MAHGPLVFLLLMSGTFLFANRIIFAQDPEMHVHKYGELNCRNRSIQLGHPNS